MGERLKARIRFPFALYHNVHLAEPDRRSRIQLNVQLPAIILAAELVRDLHVIIANRPSGPFDLIIQRTQTCTQAPSWSFTGLFADANKVADIIAQEIGPTDNADLRVVSR